MSTLFKKKVKSKRIAMTGSRKISSPGFKMYSLLASMLHSTGHHLTSGDADGSDYAVRVGVENSLSVVPRADIGFTAYLPWTSFNSDKRVNFSESKLITCKKSWMESVDKYHPNPTRLTNPQKLLMARNYGIVADPKVDLSISLFTRNRVEGGTAQTVRICADLGIPYLALTETQLGELMIELKMMNKLIGVYDHLIEKMESGFGLRL